MGTTMRTVLVAVAVASLLLSGCGGRPAGSPAVRTAGDVLSDLLQLFTQSDIDDVARGGADDLDEVFKANRAIVDEAFKVTAFQSAVRSATSTADSEAQRLASRFDVAAQRVAEDKLKTMLCESRLYAQNQYGDVEVLRPWIAEEFREVEILLTDAGMELVATWLTEKVNDRTSTYSLACMAWVRGTR